MLALETCVSVDRTVCEIFIVNFLQVVNFVFSFWLHSSQVSESVGRSFDREKDSWLPGDSDRTLGKQPFHVLKAGQLLLLWSRVEGKCFFLAHTQLKWAFASGGLLSGWRGFSQYFFSFLERLVLESQRTLKEEKERFKHCWVIQRTGQML